MTRFTILTATAIALSAPAFAYTGVSPTMVASVEAILAESGLAGTDLTQLTDEQIVEIYGIAQGADANEQINGIKSVLEGQGTSRAMSERRVILVDRDPSGLMPAGENSVTVSVQNWLDVRGVQVDASTLTDAQIAQLYFLAYGNDGMVAEQGQIDAILAM